ncbi:hypothetical protein JYQ62_07990 [Nostoc sp. UHCC 0702]|nr:hypothetical protein JYQ62_07990 [Nostoc sp. UHCC 0702]
MQTTEIPVTIIYLGAKPNFLNFALKSAANFNNTVVFIGDKTNKDLWSNYWDSTLKESSKFQAFFKNYVHMSTTGEHYTLAGIQRFFYLEQWMQQENIKKTFLLDGDIVTFTNYSEQLYSAFSNDCIASLSTPEDQESNFRWASSPHLSYWTLEGLEDFTNFCIEAYSNKSIRDQLEAKWQWHLANNKPGGIMDMTLLYLWSKGNSQVGNVAKVINDTTVDHTITSPTNYFRNEYRMQLGLKKIIFKNGIPYGYNQVLNKEIRFLCLHCQGTSAKDLMRFFYYKQLRNFYPIANFVAITQLQTKNFIKKLIRKK